MKNSATIKWLFGHTKKHMWKMAILIFLNVFFATLTVLFAFSVKGVVDSAIARDKDGLIKYSVLLVTEAVLQFVCRFSINGLSERVKAGIEMDLRSKIFSEILGKKYKNLTEYHSGELMNRLTADVQVISTGITGIVPTVVSAVARLLMAVGALAYLDWVFAVAFSVAGALVFVVLSVTRGKLKSLHKKIQETDGRTRSFMQECIEHVLAIKVFSADKQINDKADAYQKENFDYKMKRKTYSVLGHATYNFIFSAGYIFALVYGGLMIYGLKMSYGDLSAILQLVNNVQVPFASLSGVIPQYFAMLASAERLVELEKLEDEPKQTDFDRDGVYSELKSIELKDAVFSYGKDKIFDGACLNVDKGDFVAVKGNSGIGKSTLMKLFLGVYPLDSGEFNLKTDGGEIPLSNSTRTLFSYVPQGNLVFSGTIRDNVAFARPDATDEEIDRALAVGCAKDFVDNLPLGVNTIIGENGLGLSEGQIQRIAIARAVLSRAPIILLDEATSALDEETESRVLGNFKEMKNVTLIIVTHKKRAFEICEKKIKIKDGKICPAV